MRRIYIKNINSETIKLDKENLNYIKKVLRLKNSQELLIFNGKEEFQGIFENDTVKIIATTKEEIQENPLKLAIGIIKQPRLEWLIEKATEIGVTEIFLLKTERTQNTLKNLNRIEKIAIEASKQSNRVTIPEIKEAINLKDFAKHIESETWAFGGFEGSLKLKKTINGLIIGPEGGFTKEEIEILEKKTQSIKLNNNILRAETAAIYGLSLINQNTLLNEI